MARPIANTPILTGKDAKRFSQKQRIRPSAEERAAERARIDQSVQNLRDFMQNLKNR